MGCALFQIAAKKRNPDRQPQSPTHHGKDICIANAISCRFAPARGLRRHAGILCINGQGTQKNRGYESSANYFFQVLAFKLMLRITVLFRSAGSDYADHDS